MKVFLAAVVAMIIVGMGAAFALNAAQRSAGVAYSTDGARIHPKWSFRQTIQKSVDKVRPAKAINANAGLNPSGMAAEDDAAAWDSCEQSSALRWLFVDFSDSNDESGCKT